MAALWKIPLLLSFVSLLGFIEELGFNLEAQLSYFLGYLYVTSIMAGLLALAFRYGQSARRPLAKVRVFDAALTAVLILVLLNLSGWIQLPLFSARRYLFLGVGLVFFREFSTIRLNLGSQRFNPAQIFIGSFLLLIFIGSLLLKLPNATHHGISYLDAVFTATSAVCVTGLIVVDTGSYFTTLGQTVIMLLVQVGGLGIMTFTSYFSYFFMGGSSYESQLMLREMMNSEKLGQVFNTLKKVLLLTFAFEAVGVVLIYINTNPDLFGSTEERGFFALFHSISGFCNAGFSTLGNGLYQAEFRFNYSLQLIIVSLFIVGGLGFPILFNFNRYLKYLLLNRLLGVHPKGESGHRPWVLNLNSRIVLITTMVLLILGTGVVYWGEGDNTLAAHQGWARWLSAFFTAATPRTAGFNVVDTSAMGVGTLMCVILLMWIGASPGSTGGGIKTTTFSVAMLNAISQARGKDRLEAFGREISALALRRAFAIVVLSLVVIFVASVLVTAFNPEMSLFAIIFECFSAYSTVGLSMGITGALSPASKLVIILTMFIGRVSMLTVLVAVLRRVKHLAYRYPQENILIN